MTVERPSSHAVIVRLEYGVSPVVASAVGINRNPQESHSFATVRTPDRSGYGGDLVDEVESAQPHAVICDSARLGKPDLVPVGLPGPPGLRGRRRVVVGNKASTWRVVHGLERLGIPAFGPIWDS